MVHKNLGVKVDVSAALSEFERRAIQRKKRLRYGEVKANICTPEDLILFNSSYAQHESFATKTLRHEDSTKKSLLSKVVGWDFLHFLVSS